MIRNEKGIQMDLKIQIVQLINYNKSIHSIQRRHQSNHLCSRANKMGIFLDVNNLGLQQKTINKMTRTRNIAFLSLRMCIDDLKSAEKVVNFIHFYLKLPHSPNSRLIEFPEKFIFNYAWIIALHIASMPIMDKIDAEYANLA